MHIDHIKEQLHRFASVQKAEKSTRFFKVKEGEYSYGDIFIGVTAPEIKSVAKLFAHSPLSLLSELLSSPIHEERMLALQILLLQYAKGNRALRDKIFDFYLQHMNFINNWDLVDCSAPALVGQHLAEQNKDLLYHLVEKSSLWERRIAIVSTLYFIRQCFYLDTLKITEILLTDKEDLIHKACGWMLREVGKRDTLVLEGFLKEQYQVMPRTMLRYAIEKFSAPKKELYMKK